MTRLEIELRISHWNHWFCMQFHRETAEVLVERGWREGADVAMVDDTLVAVPGGGAYRQSAHASAEWSHAWSWDMRTSPFQMPIFGLTELRGTVGPRGSLEVVVPPVHELEWPAANYRLEPERWIEVMQERLDSAMLAGLPRLDAPSHVRRMSGLWAEALRRASMKRGL